jgi:hypothetical protein
MSTAAPSTSKRRSHTRPWWSTSTTAHSLVARSWCRSATGPGSPAPLPDHVQAFDTLFTKYIALRDYFGRGANDLMHRLKVIRREQATGAPGEHGGELVRPGLKQAATKEGATA